MRKAGAKYNKIEIDLDISTGALLKNNYALKVLHSLVLAGL
jgi:hypothetical protein